MLAFTADPDWRNELKYESPDLWTVTTDGKVTRVTDDGYVYGDVAFSPDGQFLSYARSFGTDMIVAAEAESRRTGRSLHPARRRRRADQPDRELGSRSRATSAGRPTASSSTSPPQIGGESHLFRVAPAAGGDGRAGHQGRATAGQPHLSIARSRRIAYTVGLHEAPPEVYVGQHRRHQRAQAVERQRDRSSPRSPSARPSV